MDVNGTKFYMLAEGPQWSQREGTDYDAVRRCLRLEKGRTLDPAKNLRVEEFKGLMDQRIAQVPHTYDSFGTRAFWEERVGEVLATGAAPGAVSIFVPPAKSTVTSMVLGIDGVLYIAVDGELMLHDLRGRWTARIVPKKKSPEADAIKLDVWRLAADPRGGVWILDKTNRQLARMYGVPLPDRPYGPYDADNFRPCWGENNRPPTLEIVADADFKSPEDPSRDSDEQPVAIACDPDGLVAVISYVEGKPAALRTLSTQDRWSKPVSLEGAYFPTSLAFVAAGTVAVMTAEIVPETPVYQLASDEQSLRPTGDYYPLSEHDGGPFLTGIPLPPQYPTDSGVAPLVRISLPEFNRLGKAWGVGPLDSGIPQVEWHRLYLEASIPSDCGIKVYLSTSDSNVAPDDSSHWQEFRFGRLYASEVSREIPRAAWVPIPSEIPYHPGYLPCEPERSNRGLFTVLIQRCDRPVRAMKGRFLWVRVELEGDGRATPELFALRAYAPRFSYVDNYLPELYRESLLGSEAEKSFEAGSDRATTPADFLERFLFNFEGMMTVLEDRIAASWLLTDPSTTPPDSLAWLADWIGLTLDNGLPTERQRRMVSSASELYRRRGTAKGLELALDIATGGAVSRGHLIVLEEWRLRRTLATILGADLADEEDPLLAGMAVSGNSYVGDTLIVGSDTQKEFLALFGPQVIDPNEVAPEGEKTEAEELKEFLHKLTHRVTVLVHSQAYRNEMGLIRRIVGLESPAHIISRVVEADYSFLVGLAGLVGIDTYLSVEDRPAAVRIGASHVGLRDLLRRLPALDPRLEGGTMVDTHELKPVARLRTSPAIKPGEAVLLDGSESYALKRRHLVEYEWTWVSSRSNEEND